MIPPLDVDATSEAGKPRASGDDPFAFTVPRAEYA